MKKSSKRKLNEAATGNRKVTELYHPTKQVGGPPSEGFQVVVVLH